MSVKLSLVNTVQSAVVARRTVPIAFAINASAGDLSATTMAVISADLAFLTSSPRVGALAATLVSNEGSVMLARDVADLALVACESTNTLAGTGILVKHSTVEAARGTLLAFGSLSKRRTLALALVGR